MPKSKHRRKGQRRPRAREMAPPPKNPEPSPTWVPATGVTLLSIGIGIIIAGYLPFVQDVTETWWKLGSNWTLVGGFVLLAGGFGFLTQWR